MEPIPYGYHWLEEADIEEVTQALRGRWITQGPVIDRFEAAVAGSCGARYAVAFSSGTAALHGACFAARIAEGDEVITSALTFVASANAVLYQGGRPVFADIAADTLNLSPSDVRRKVTPRTKALLPVHFAGLPAPLEEIRSIAQQSGLKVIEDASHAFGAEWTDSGGNRRRVGSCSHSDMTVFSFHPVKHITSGEGGMVLTQQEELRDRLRLFRNHGLASSAPGNSSVEEPGAVQMEELGYNYRITDFQCALGLSQLRRAGGFLDRREELASAYRQRLQTLGLTWQAVPEGVRHAWHLLVVQLPRERMSEDRNGIFKRLRRLGVGVQVHYLPVPLQPYYRRRFGYRAGDFPAAERYYQRALTLPLFPRLTERQFEELVGEIRRVLSEAGCEEPVGSSCKSAP